MEELMKSWLVWLVAVVSRVRVGLRWSLAGHVVLDISNASPLGLHRGQRRLGLTLRLDQQSRAEANQVSRFGDAVPAAELARLITAFNRERGRGCCRRGQRGDAISAVGFAR